MKRLTIAIIAMIAGFTINLTLGNVEVWRQIILLNLGIIVGIIIGSSHGKNK
jgi:hypothetical protein